MTGHIKVVFSRGKKRLGFDLNGNFKFKNGMLEVLEATDSGDFDYTIDKHFGKGTNFDGYIDIIKAALNHFVENH